MRTVESIVGPFRCWDQDLVGHILSTGQFWDQQIQPALDEGDPAGWAIDLGANIGWFTVYLAKRYAHVIAVEAHPGTYSLLAENIIAHGVADKVTAICAAAYDRETILQLASEEYLGWPVPSPVNLDSTHNASSIAFVPAADPGARTPLYVPAIAVDQVLQLHRRKVKTTPITMIKVDCQGADLRALVGLRETIRTYRPIVVFEYESGPSLWHGDHWADYEAFFEHHHYQVTRIREDLWDYVARPKVL